MFIPIAHAQINKAICHLICHPLLRQEPRATGSCLRSTPLVQPKLSIHGAGQKDRSSGYENDQSQVTYHITGQCSADDNPKGKTESTSQCHRQNTRRKLNFIYSDPEKFQHDKRHAFTSSYINGTDMSPCRLPRTRCRFVTRSCPTNVMGQERVTNPLEEEY